MPRPAIRALILAAILPLAACGTAELPMPYSPTVAPRLAAAARPVVAVGTVTDERQDGQANTAQFGTIRGGYGNPVRRLAAPQPVAQVVAQAFRDALAARGLLAANGGGAYELRVRILQYNASKLIRTGADTQFQATLVNRATGATAWAGEGRSELIEAGDLVAAGVLANPEELRGTMLRSMAASIDQILDRPEFLAALR